MAEERKQLISIIVPIYNAASYLRECLDSLMCQTYLNLELILVDDGSTDGCSAICDEYEQKDSRIKVIKKPHEGVGSARNAGIATATGELIGFVDADDYCDPIMYEELQRLLVTYNADTSICGWYRVDEKGTHADLYSEKNIRLLSNREVLHEYNTRNSVGGQVWNKLYKRKIVCEIKFPEGVVYEDTVAFPQFFAKEQKVVVSTEPLYYYRKRSDSITNTNSVKNFLDHYKAIEMMNSSFEAMGITNLVDDHRFNIAHKIMIALESGQSCEDEKLLIDLKEKIMRTVSFASLGIRGKIKYILIKMFRNHYSVAYPICRDIYHALRGLLFVRK